MRTIDPIPFPKGFEAVHIAEAFTAYLLGCGAADNPKHIRGPFPLDADRFQLDGSNDYWMRYDDETRTFILSCRHAGQIPVVEAMIALFELRYLR